MSQNHVHRSCIYCGEPAKGVKKGEHIIQEALGGKLANRNVCKECNGKFSQIDDVLVSQSPLAFVASEVIGKRIPHIWELERNSNNNTLLEAWYNWETNNLWLFPQILFESSGIELRGDSNEIFPTGKEAFENLVFKSVMKAFKKYDNREKKWKEWFHFERIKHLRESEDYRFPPRIFLPYRISEIRRRFEENRKISAIVRYRGSAELRHVLNTLDNWNSKRHSKDFTQQLGSGVCEIHSFMDTESIVRALFKISINLLSWLCPNTPVNYSSFREVIEIIKGEKPLPPNLLEQNGFVKLTANDVLGVRDDAHEFYVQHFPESENNRSYWRVITYFFGGRIATVVRFPGPNNENWNRKKVVAPIDSSNWVSEKISFLLPFRNPVEWQDISKMIPKMNFFNVRSTPRMEERRPRSNAKHSRLKSGHSPSIDVAK